MRILVMLAATLAMSVQDRSTSVAFERFKEQLTGTWSFVEEGKTYDAAFEAVSHGQALLERNSGFIAVYHCDNTSLLMTLYTRDGNQPRFRARELGQIAKSIKFEFVDITNWKKETEHMNGLEILFKDRDHIVETWEVLQQNGTKSTFAFDLTRKTE